LRPPVFETVAVFGFQGSIGGLRSQDTISAFGLSIAYFSYNVQTLIWQGFQRLGESNLGARSIKPLRYLYYSRKI
jgi:hypothetical protein